MSVNSVSQEFSLMADHIDASALALFHETRREYFSREHTVNPDLFRENTRKEKTGLVHGVSSLGRTIRNPGPVVLTSPLKSSWHREI
ncbi:MAG: hypothetical protein M1493_15440 [Firmicutes bacterium]|nr:hypothetical protein [Bacillota bacterium]